ncbi:MFS transporter [Spiractinospora alimapuensis]|uniref:MFS transporter n=1 Tax=Spiractinospora alimapuensis TaxID=2820884 RepID=UPI001F1FFC5E|nr:MFS transporter [Spiractinospora alimapuensis]QVQ53791.1 MFS transporter [Spiractinospora alimapuensis]
MTTIDTETEAPPKAPLRAWFGLAVLTLPVFMLATDMSVLFIAIPSITADLNPTGAQLLWTLHVGEFLAAGLVLTMGRLTDLIGRRRLLMIGVAAYGTASLVAAFSTSAEMLIAMRALLGVAAATAMPSAIGLLRTMFPDPKQFGVAFATVMTSFSGGAALGPPLGGVLLEYFWWGSVFLANVPVAIVVLVAAPFLLPAYRDPLVGRLDAVSIALSVGGVMALIFGLQESAAYGVKPLYVASVVVGLVLGAMFIRRQRRLADPLLDLRFFTSPSVPAALLVGLLSLLAFGATDLFMTQHLQVSLGLSPARVGLLLVVPAVASIVTTMLVPVITRFLRPAVALSAGLAVAVAGAAVVIVALRTGVVWPILVGLAVLSAGAAVALTLAAQLVVSVAPEERAGSAAAMNDVSSGFGYAIGLALVGSIGNAIYRWSLGDSAPNEVTGGDLSAAQESAGGAVSVAEGLPAGLGDTLVDAAAESITLATQGAFIFGSVIAALAIAVVLWRLRHARLV